MRVSGHCLDLESDKPEQTRTFPSCSGCILHIRLVKSQEEAFWKGEVKLSVAFKRWRLNVGARGKISSMLMLHAASFSQSSFQTVSSEAEHFVCHDKAFRVFWSYFKVKTKQTNTQFGLIYCDRSTFLFWSIFFFSEQLGALCTCSNQLATREGKPAIH